MFVVVFHVVTSAAVSGEGLVEIWVRNCVCDPKNIFELRAHGQDFVDLCFNLRFSFFALFGSCALRASGSTRRGSLGGMVDGAWRRGNRAPPGERDFPL